MARGRTYVVQQDDKSYEAISGVVYGDALGAALLAQANPGTPEPPPPGTVLNVPERPEDAVVDVAADVAPDECELRVDGRRMRFFSSMQLTRTFDSVSTLSFTSPQAQSEDFAQAFSPMSFAPVEVRVGGARLYNGTILAPSVRTDPDAGPMLTLDGYSVAGVLWDCTPPVSAFPLQLKGLGLRDIAARLCQPFGIRVDAVGDMGGPFKRLRIEPGTKIVSFLETLAKQRKVVMADTPDGGLLLRAPPSEGSPVAEFVEGQPPFAGGSIRLNPNQFYSHVTVMRKTARRVDATSYTVKNPALNGVLRPLITRAEDTANPAELAAVSEAQAGRMLAGAVSWTLENIPTWRDAQGELWAPGATVSVLAPSMFVREPTSMLVRAVQFRRDVEAGTTAQLELVLPGAFSGVLPARYPWDL